MSSRVASQTPQSAQARLRVLAAAGEVFARHGLEGTRVDQIADAAGLHRATLFHYFRNKGEMYQAVMRQVLEELHARLSEALEGSAPSDMVTLAIDAYLDLVFERPWIARLLLREVVDRSPGEAQDILRYSAPIIEKVTNVIRKHHVSVERPSIDPLHLVVMISGAMNLLIAAAPSLGPSTARIRPKQQKRIKEGILALVRAATGAGSHQRS